MRLRYLLWLAVAGVLVWGVAPALSLTPYRPEPVMFEQALPELERLDTGQDVRAAGAHGDEGPVKHLSPVIEAPGRFDLVGIGGELRPIEYRARDEGGEWSKWMETANGDPAWFGGADELQLRSRGVRPEGELSYINLSGDDDPLHAALTSVRSAVNTAFISTASLAVAEADVPKPDVVTRGQWDPRNQCKPRSNPSYGEVKAAVVHHTVNTNNYSRKESKSIVLGICLFHRNDNGWNDIGYNALVSKQGLIFEGRDGGLRRAVVGAHAEGYNSQTTGVASIGNHEEGRISDKGRHALVRYLAWKLDHHGLKANDHTRLTSAGGSTNRYPSGRKVRVNTIYPHGRTNTTACPGSRLDREMGEIRDATQRRIRRTG
jgi:uncharacterized protein with LGFP repeats